MAWVNNDGLRVKFGTEEGTSGKGGTLATPANGGVTVHEWVITATSLTTTPTIIDFDTRIGTGARIERVEVISETACTSGGSATLDIGFKRASDFSTELDHNGLVAALALASINVAGEVNLLTPGVTSAGALIGTDLANTGVLVASYGTAAFTAGVLKVRVYTSVPYTS